MNFDGLITVADWTSALQQLVALADAAVQSGNQDDMANVQDLLFAFRQQSPPTVNNLDALAFSVSNELNRQNRQLALNKLKELGEELADLSKSLGAATEQALMRSDEIQLKNTKEVLNKAKVSLEVLKSLRQDLQDPATPLGQKVGDVFAAIHEFERAFQ